MGEEHDPERTQALDRGFFVCAHVLLSVFLCVFSGVYLFSMGVIVWVHLKLSICVHILNLRELYIFVCQPITIQA